MKSFQILSRTESAMSAAAASVLSVVTVGAVMALFATAAPDTASLDRVVLDTLVISAPKAV